MLGRFTLDAIIHGPIVLTTQILFVLVILGVIALLFYTKRWKWLWREWLTSVDPKKIGIMYLILAGIMLIRGGVDALLMRTQQAIAVGGADGFLTANHFAEIFTAHGVIMIFFVAMPFMFGLMNYIAPLQIGSRDVAFPFLNSLAFWLTAGGAMLVMLSLVFGEFAPTGWLAYPPLSEGAFTPGVGVAYWIWALQISGVGTTLAAVNFIATIFKMRAPGMTLMRMPIFTWTVLVTNIMIIFAFPILTGTLSMLMLDRLIGAHFFTAGFGGNMMMYVNLIWAWGHPEVYIVILPAFGIWSEIVATFSRKRLFGYTSMVFATMGIAVFSFIVWLHHFFTMGAHPTVNAFFGIMTMVIAIPTGVKLFNWIFTMYRGRIRFTSPMYWFLGFVFTFTLGGMTGVLLSIPPADYQFHNSLFLIAHFHTMLVGGVLFAYFAGLTYWFPKMFGFKLDERWGKRAFWCWLVGFWTAFGPLYLLGTMGATRRMSEYGAGQGWYPLFVIAGIGAVIIAIGVLCQFIQLVVSIRRRKKEGYLDRFGDPWDGRALEWSIPSPVPEYAFATIPRVYGKDAYWDMKYGDGSKYPEGKRETISMPKNTGVGFVMAGCAFLFGFGFVWYMWWLVVISFIALIVCLLYRVFSEKEREYKIPPEEVDKIEMQLQSKKYE